MAGSTAPPGDTGGKGGGNGSGDNFGGGCDGGEDGEDDGGGDVGGMICVGGEYGGDGDGRGPQSVQSVPTEQSLYSEPGPPSSQSPSEAQLHV